MQGFEDHFSQLARQYAQYRPQYPGELFEYLAYIAPGRRLAWDCGTGNGQAALELARHFERVIATDASAEQITQAPAHERIQYLVKRAEEMSFEFIEERYQTLPFPFEELQPPKFEMQANWVLGQAAGFLDSWTATHRYKQERGRHPVGLIWHELSNLWGEPSLQRIIRWPLSLRVGRIR